MSIYSGLMDFVVVETVKLLAGVTNAPTLIITTTGTGDNQVVVNTECTNVIPFYQPNGVSGLKNVHDDIVFYNVEYVDDPYNKQVNSTYSTNIDNSLTTLTMHNTRVVRISWACCGDNGFEWAERIRLMLFDSDIREDFKVQNMALVPSVGSPVFAPEILGQEWIHRYDVSAKFYQSVIVAKAQPAVSTANIIIRTSEGVEVVC